MKNFCVLAIFAISGASVSAQNCRQTEFSGYVKGGEAYTHEMNSKLEFRLTPLKNNWGWTISVSPKGSTDDWTFPVTAPIRTGEGQLLGTGYGSTAREKLRYPASVQFVLTESAFRRYSKLTYETLESSRVEAAKEY